MKYIMRSFLLDALHYFHLLCNFSLLLRKISVLRFILLYVSTFWIYLYKANVDIIFNHKIKTFNYKKGTGFIKTPISQGKLKSYIFHKIVRITFRNIKLKIQEKKYVSPAQHLPQRRGLLNVQNLLMLLTWSTGAVDCVSRAAITEPSNWMVIVVRTTNWTGFSWELDD